MSKLSLYNRIKVGRGHCTRDLKGPFYARPFINGEQFWKTLSAESYAEAREDADNLTAVLEARAEGPKGNTNQNVGIEDTHLSELGFGLTEQLLVHPIPICDCQSTGPSFRRLHSRM